MAARPEYIDDPEAHIVLREELAEPSYDDGRVVALCSTHLLPERADPRDRPLCRACARRYDDLPDFLQGELVAIRGRARNQYL